MRPLIQAIEALTQALGYLGAVLIVPLILATCYEVFARYAMGAPTIWAFELGYMLMGVHFLMGGAFATSREAHVRIDLIYDRFSPRTKALVDGALYILLLVCLIFVTLRLFDYTYSSYVSGEGSGQSAWNPPIWPFRAMIVLSFAVLSLQILAEIMKCALLVSGGENLRDRETRT
jgi:TRAP-type mannitol/chloroaromatic compound transport system permease small subunit